jgi:RimJ/RimL family protein N-acetyltransferase
MRDSAENVFFYCCHGEVATPVEAVLGFPYNSRLWTPTQGGIVPAGLPVWPFAVWTCMHHLRLFGSREYGLFLVHQGDRLVHRSGLFPRYARFPFMGRNDLQIGDVWTHPAHQNRGLASFAVQQILHVKAKPGRSIWYVVDATNLPSIRMVEKLGFVRVGVGVRSRRLGSSLLGQFVMNRCETARDSPW